MRRTSLLLVTLAVLSPEVAAQPHDNSACKPHCYVAVDGSDLEGDGTEGSPWASLMKCYNEIDPGDTCYFKAGVYEAPSSSSEASGNPGWDLGAPCKNQDNGGTNPQPPYYCTRERQSGGTPGSPKTIAGAPGTTADEVIFTQREPVGACQHLMNLRNKADHLVFRGITFEHGRNDAEANTSNIEFTECVFRCPNTNEQDNMGILFSGANQIMGCEDWYVHNNLFYFDSTCDGATMSNLDCNRDGKDHQTIHHVYSQSGSLWENNSYIIESDATVKIHDMIGFKASNQFNTIRYNYVEDRSGGGESTGNWFGSTQKNAQGQNQVYQNIFVGNWSGIEQSGHTVGEDKYYNNTIYDAENCQYTHSGTATNDLQFFNNICVTKDQAARWEIASDPANQAYNNNHLYWSIGGITPKWSDGLGGNYEGLSAWQSHLASDKGLGSSLNEDASTFEDPLFVDASVGDFRLQAESPARTGGRGGSYSTVRGAYITGSETIGCEFHPLCHAYSGSPACSDGSDNDNDGKVDHPADPGCADPEDTSELGTTACDDGVDNDGDGKTDAATDPGCTGPEDSSELGTAACDNGADDDGDGVVDMDDPGCADPSDASEHGEVACDDGIDNDGDGQIDGADPGCSDLTDTSEAGACDDGADNDGDGFIDYPEDPGCTDANDASELGTAACDDGADNDSDGTVDMLDPGCGSPDDGSELGDSACDDGADNDGDGTTDTEDPGCTGPSDASELGTVECDDGLDNDSDGATDYPADGDCDSATDASESFVADECSSPDPTWVLCDGFEDGTLDYWGDDQSTQDGAFHVSSSNPHSGDFHARMDHQEGQASLAWGAHFFADHPELGGSGEQVTDLYLRMRVRYSVDVTGGKIWTVNAFEDWSAGYPDPHGWAAYYCTLYVHNTELAYRVQLHKKTTGSSDWTEFPQNLNGASIGPQANRWYTIEVHMKLNTPGLSDGVLEYWIDGTKKAEYFDVNFRDSYTDRGWNHLMIQGHRSNQLQTYFQDWDTFVGSTTYVGTGEGSGGSPPVVENLRRTDKRQ